ncbi:MAG: VapC toxin family PIN domain ribonuclease [Rhizobium sp. 63-7]|nr:MAG: VapC toxin family PIN domain ribonuclease [Rhizobium sp. 63-7]
MIVADTSALMAMLLGEPAATACLSVFEREEPVLISAATVTEALIVATRRQIGPQMKELLSSPALQIVAITSDRARHAAEAYERWGKGNHPAGLNFGDCFSYAVAKEFACPLLYVGNDFSGTDIASALEGK